MTKLIPFGTLTETPWANGQGRKADIDHGDGWSLAFAWLDRPAPFSDYKGVARTITLLEGRGFVLDFPDHPALHVEQVGVPANFDGGWPAQCRLLGGPCFVLNAFSNQRSWRQNVSVAEPSNVGQLRADDFIVVLRGRVWLDDLTAGNHDTLRINGTGPILGSADALIALIRFEKRA